MRSLSFTSSNHLREKIICIIHQLGGVSMSRSGSRARKKPSLHGLTRERIPREKSREFFEQLIRSDDRSLAIAATAAIEQTLIRLLQKFLIPLDDKGLAETFYDQDGLLATFSRQIKMAYLLGLFPKKLRDDLDNIRRLRNVFAHWAFELKFTEPLVAEICAKLETKRPGSQPRTEPRWQFFETAFEVEAQLFQIMESRMVFRLE